MRLDQNRFDRALATLISSCGGTLQGVDTDAAADALFDALIMLATQLPDPDKFMLDMIKQLRKVVDEGELPELRLQNQRFAQQQKS